MNTDNPDSKWQIIPCGDAALTVVFSSSISLRAVEHVQSTFNLLSAKKLAWIQEIIPAFTTLTVLIDVMSLSFHTQNPLEFARQGLNEVLMDSSLRSKFSQSRTVTLPICFDEEFALDIAEVALVKNMSVEALCKLYCSTEYRVAMIGFTPGFPYLLGLPEVLSMPRKSSPRARVEAGSVGIAGKQTGMYPVASPGGWNIIGRVPERLFLPEKMPPTLLCAGDKVRFEAVSKGEFTTMLQSMNKSILTAHQQEPQRKEDNSGTIELIHSGFQMTIQDSGRAGFRQYGVPQSGFADRYSGEIANMLVGNARTDAALEVLHGKAVVRFSRDAVIAVCGAITDVIAEYDGKRQLLPMNTPIALRSGALLKLEGAKKGVWTYIAVRGGIAVPKVLGSRSTYARAGLGGLSGRALQRGDILEIGNFAQARQRTVAFEQLFFQSFSRNSSQNSLNAAQILTLPLYLPEVTVQEYPHRQTSIQKLRVLRGAEWGGLSEDSQQTLFRTTFTVLPQSDKMGLRLDGSPEGRLSCVLLEQLISRGVLPGTVQIPPDGRPIILAADSQTTGGYPVAIHVCSVDVPLAAQCRPNDRLVFQEISSETAQKLYIEKAQALNMLEQRLKTRLQAISL